MWYAGLVPAVLRRALRRKGWTGLRSLPPVSDQCVALRCVTEVNDGAATANVRPPDQVEMWSTLVRSLRYAGLARRRTVSSAPSCRSVDRSKRRRVCAAIGASTVVAVARAYLHTPVSLAAKVESPGGTASTFAVIPTEKAPPPLSRHHRQLALNLLEVLDQNNDGTLTFNELLKLTAMTEPHWSDGRRREKARRLLATMDANADGHVSKDEFLTYIQHQYETFAERRHLFSVIDHLDRLHELTTGGHRDRSATTIVQQHEIVHIASLVNAVVDLEFFDEDQEQEIFEDAVVKVLRVLDDVLPHPYKQLVVASPNAPGLPDQVAEELKLRLEAHIEQTLTLPCLEEPEERRVRMAVVEIVVEAMKSNTSLAVVSDAHRSGPIIMNIFVRGAIGMLRPGSTQRDGVVATVAENVSIPMVPIWLTQKAAEYVLTKVELIVEEGITHIFQKHIRLAKQAIKAAEKNAASAGHKSMRDIERHINVALQDYLRISFAKEQFHAEVQEEMVNLMEPHIAHLPLTTEQKRRLSVMFVEHSILSIIDLDRLSDAMSYVVSKQHEEQAFETGGALVPSRV